MRIVSGTRIAPVALAAALALAACVPAPPPVTLPPQPSSTPLFASEEEALAAAEEVYGAYWAAADEVGRGGWADVEPLIPFITEDALSGEREQAADFVAQGVSLEGATSARMWGLQAYDDSGARAELRAYTCVDVSATKLVDESGRDVTPTSRPELVPLEVTFIAEAPDGFRIDRSEPWVASSFC